MKVRALTMLYFDEKRIREGEVFDFPLSKMKTVDGKKVLPSSVMAIDPLPSGMVESVSEHEKSHVENDPKIDPTIQDKEKKSIFGKNKKEKSKDEEDVI